MSAHTMKQQQFLKSGMECLIPWNKNNTKKKVGQTVWSHCGKKEHEK